MINDAEVMTKFTSVINCSDCKNPLVLLKSIFQDKPVITDISTDPPFLKAIFLYQVYKMVRRYLNSVKETG